MPSSKLAGSLVVVAKCPLPGESKTRLIPLVGEEGSSQLATAMLADVLTCLTLLDTSSRSVDRILLYAPPTEEGRRKMEEVLEMHSIPWHREDDVSQKSGSTRSSKSRKSSSSNKSQNRKLKEKDVGADAWTLLPMSNERIESNKSRGKAPPINMKSSFLSDVLANALHRARQRQVGIYKQKGPVVFVGMDSPELPLDEVQHSLLLEPQKARLCPAADGGYGLLSVPFHAPANAVFDGVRWSDPLTAVSQLKALTDQKIDVIMGRLMHDIDEPDDVTELVGRLQKTEGYKESDSDDVLLRRSVPSSRGSTSSCLFTRQALTDLRLWKKREKLHTHTDGSTECCSSTDEPQDQYNDDEEGADKFAVEHQLTQSSSYTI